MVCFAKDEGSAEILSLGYGKFPKKKKKKESRKRKKGGRGVITKKWGLALFFPES